MRVWVASVLVAVVLSLLLLLNKKRQNCTHILRTRDLRLMLRKGKHCRRVQDMFSRRSELYDGVTRALRNNTMERQEFTETFDVKDATFGTQQVLITESSVLSPSECQDIVRASERVFARVGYETRGVLVTTRDQRVSRLPKQTQDVIFRALRECIQQYIVGSDVDFTNMFPTKKNCFVIRYDMGPKGQRDCKPHFDTSDMGSVSIVINLSDDYEGGGTEMYEYPGNRAKVACPRKGHGAVFNGSKLLHGGVPIRSGTRFVLVALFQKRFNFFTRWFG